MTTSNRRWPVWPWLVLTVAGIVVTVVAAIVGTAASGEDAAGASPIEVTVTVTQVQTSAVRVTVTVAPPPEVPATTLLDGLHTVGVEVQPGIYQTTGPSGTNAGGCYWTRSDGEGGLIDNGVITGPGTLTVNLDELVETAGCEPWQKVG
ncbi:hypothetical protein [Actinophytocola glycyrrhizae]|uniref:DUF4430 domain-containing protein n=1 Tax=Actinophytocola glycyrrhizae TaxID=2044873 RepID=A0ABV9S071_9PSEU